MANPMVFAGADIGFLIECEETIKVHSLEHETKTVWIELFKGRVVGLACGEGYRYAIPGIHYSKEEFKLLRKLKLEETDVSLARAINLRARNRTSRLQASSCSGRDSPVDLEV